MRTTTNGFFENELVTGKKKIIYINCFSSMENENRNVLV